MGTERKTKEDFEKELKERFPNNSIEIINYTKASGPIEYKCLTCGRIHKKSRANHLYENKTLCSKCYTARESEIRNKFLNYISKRDDLEIVKFIESTTEKVTLKCLKCNSEFQIQMNNFITTDHHTCPICGKNGAPISREEFERRMKLNGKEEYEILRYEKATSPMLIRHNCGFIYKVKPCNFLKNKGCPKCYGNMSKGERDILEFLEDNHITYERQKKFLKTELGLKSYDFYLPNQNILIEYQGEQHYRPADYWGGEEKFEEQKKNDEIKRNFAKKHNMKLIEIPCWKRESIPEILSFLKGSTTTSVDSSESKEKLK